MFVLWFYYLVYKFCAYYFKKYARREMDWNYHEWHINPLRLCDEADKGERGSGEKKGMDRRRKREKSVKFR